MAWADDHREITEAKEDFYKEKELKVTFFNVFNKKKFSILKFLRITN